MEWERKRSYIAIENRSIAKTKNLNSKESAAFDAEISRRGNFRIRFEGGLPNRRLYWCFIRGFIRGREEIASVWNNFQPVSLPLVLTEIRASRANRNRNSHTERRTLATGGVRVTRRPTCNQCPHPGQICNFQQYNLPKPSPPIPPRRSSSLPKESRVIECISNPTAPLTPFSLSTEDSYFLQFMLTGSLSKLDFFSKTKLWPMALHRFHTEPAIRHILLGTTMVHRQRAHPNDSQYGNPERSATRHYGKAIRLLSASLANVTQRLQGETREITILTTFLLAAFEILRRNDDRATYWMENGMKLLGRATNATPTLPTRKIEQDANSKQLAQAFEMMDVNLKIKRMKNSKRIQRSIGRCGAGGLSRRKLEKRRSCIGLFHPDG